MEVNGTGKFVFGEFELDEARRLLTHAGSELNLNPKAFDLLNVLVKHVGNVVSKDELLEAVWPDQFVEENNLTVQISALRKLLTEHNGSGRLIVTVPGKGYSFVGPVEMLDNGDEIVIEQRTVERITVEHPEVETPLQLKSGGRRFGYLIPVAIGVALFAVLVGGWFAIGRSNSPKKIDAMAVMPFTYQGERADADFLSEGVTESLINNLSQLPNMTVKARSSVFQYKGRDVSPQAVGSDLGVQAVMTGKIVENGDDFALSLELVNAATGDQIWGERYSRKRTDIATLSNEIARDVVGKLRLKLSADPIARGQTKDSEAYELYLRGRFLWNKRRQNDHEAALQLFEKAIARDPNFALGYAAIADVCGVDSYKPPEGVDCAEKGRRFAAKALEIEPQLSDPYGALGNFEMGARNWRKADEYYKKAIELNPNNGNAHHWRAEMLVRLRRSDEAVAEIRTALLIDPLSQIFNDDYAYILAYSRRYEEALAQARRSNEMNAEWGYDYIVFANEYMERYSDALDASVGHPITGDKKSSENIARFNQQLERIKARFQKEGPIGYWKGWLDVVEEYNASNVKKQYTFASICHTKIGEYDKALDMLEKSIDAHEGGVDLSYAEPHYDPLREMPRYKELMRKLGFDVN